MEEIYSLSDTMIRQRIGARIKAVRLRQNIMQQSLAEECGVSLSSVKKIEKGEIGSFDSLLRMMRMLGLLETLQPLVEEVELSPNEYYELVHSTGKRMRKRAAGNPNRAIREVAEW